MSKFCRDCKHFEEWDVFSTPHWQRCNRVRDIVSGGSTGALYRLHPDHECGPGGKLFEPKPVEVVIYRRPVSWFDRLFAR